MGQAARDSEKSLFVSLVVTILIIAAGLIVFYFLSKEMHQQVITGTSKLGSLNTLKNSQTENANKTADIKSIISDNQKKVMYIEVNRGSNVVTGSGFLYDTSGDIITNAHVVEGASTVKVKTYDGQVYNGTVIGRSKDVDVALIRVPELAGKTPVKISSRKGEIGDPVIAMGSPLGLQNTATTGIISGVNRDFTIPPYEYKGVYQISAPISPGSSGGPLLDQNTGEVLGVNSAGTVEGVIGFSIPINQVLPLVENWSKNPSKPQNDQYADYTADQQEDNQDSQPIREKAEALVQSFYQFIDEQDYVTAYSLLGSDWQNSTSYQAFRTGYLRTESVRILNIVSHDKDSNHAEVTVIIEALELTDQNTERISQYMCTYIVGYENDKLKILSGTARKI
ncbi:S1C family serine protease [Caldanaerobius polysaccharolyticus]|uniref:S1C family serine protease n=1 Tax=Caldanaerobius polysaccharolyticus TaxID=44256 RepID=UPI00047A10CD|nr:trypsin-like peptidase domain-containing protein [Caldanaerobius polysaccharolyticus]